jgi:hypothetical protein
MKIILDNTLKPIEPRFQSVANPGRLIQALAAKVSDRKTRDEPAMKCLNTIPEPEDGLLPSYGLIGMLSHAYSAHINVTINPQDIWFIVMCEVAKIIKKYPDECRTLFTKSDEKITIQVPTGDPTRIDLELVIQQLQDLIPGGTDVFIPELTTMVPAAKMALNAALCDGVQNYYNYMTYCCGIPEIQVNGTDTDWWKLAHAAKQIGEMFESVGVADGAKYMKGIFGLLMDIHIDVGSGGHPDVDFWKSIFTQQNIGSGGELKIDGWISDIFFDPPKTKKIENFNSSIAIVPYENKDTGRKFKGVYGPFQYRLVDGFFVSEFVNYVFEAGDPTAPKVEPTITVERTEVKGQPRQLTATWTLDTKEG